ncbi:hypothetical protein [Candidatus Villigracilis saccharophilus]|uniref:hypothetical protein n=1 Tax=Candidatus Villigracilis saccharophilus TaxID=3140684 RepID=UPI00313525B6|nr:hypothetical protein [Anaerolineales bacterium]
MDLIISTAYPHANNMRDFALYRSRRMSVTRFPPKWITLTSLYTREAVQFIHDSKG